MRSGLRPVAISCNNSTYCSPFAALVDAQAPSESASEASNALKKADSMQENEFRGVGVLGSCPVATFSEVPPGSSQRSMLKRPRSAVSERRPWGACHDIWQRRTRTRRGIRQQRIRTAPGTIGSNRSMSPFARRAVAPGPPCSASESASAARTSDSSRGSAADSGQDARHTTTLGGLAALGVP